MEKNKDHKPERILSNLYTQIRIVNEKGVTVAKIDEYDATPIADGYIIVLRPNYDYPD